MTTKQIIELQTRIGTTPDGKWGPKSTAACRAHLRSLMPLISQWPSSDDAAMTRFYGKAGDESQLVNLNVVGLGIKYDGQPVKTIRCHHKVADSLHAALTEIAAGPAEWVLEQYAGCFNYRPMRGGSRPSKHAWGAAIDLAPDTNGLRQIWPQESDMPIEAMEAFARQGWFSAGAFWGRDAMHHEACNP